MMLNGKRTLMDDTKVVETCDVHNYFSVKMCVVGPLVFVLKIFLTIFFLVYN